MPVDCNLFFYPRVCEDWCRSKLTTCENIIIIIIIINRRTVKTNIMSLPGPDGHPILMGGVSNTPRKYYPPPSGIGRTKGTKHATAPMKPTKTDDFIMDTNSSSIVSKRSVEKLYYPGQKEYFRYFVRKFQRRSPLINRGYWLRMKAVDSVIRKFLSENEGRKKLVVNLGCG